MTLCWRIYVIFPLFQSDRMWHFAVGLYLVFLSGGVLRLAAILGLGSGVLILLFGGVIGHWVDITERMKGIFIRLVIVDFDDTFYINLTLEIDREILDHNW